MPRIPLSEMAHRPGQGSEDMDYIMLELNTAVETLTKMLDKKADQSDMVQLEMLLESVNQLTDVKHVVNALSDKMDKLLMATQQVIDLLAADTALTQATIDGLQVIQLN